MDVRWGSPVWIGVVEVPAPAVPEPPPTAPDILPTVGGTTPLGGGWVMIADSVPGNAPVVLRGYWCPPDTPETQDSAVLLGSPWPWVDVVVTGPGQYAIDPDASVPAGAAKHAIVPGYAT